MSGVRNGVKLFFSSPQREDKLGGPPILLFSGYRGYFLVIKQPGRDVDYSVPSSAEVKNEWSYTSTGVGRYYCTL
jgi:hypothetical protein